MNRLAKISLILVAVAVLGLTFAPLPRTLAAQTPSTIIGLGTLGGNNSWSYAIDVNDAGQVVG